MNKFRLELIALVVRVLANETTLIHKPTGFEVFIDELFNDESYDRRIARNVEAELVRASEATKRMKTNRKFQKIIQHI